jgi:cell wall-associated NlpC family hydrolase
MPSPQQIKRSLSQLSEESRRSTDPSSNNFATNLDVVNRSVDKISRIPANARTPGQRAALKALEIWTGTPTEYASTADIPARYGMGRLDPNDDNKADLKCNRFVAEVAATSGSPFPLSGRNPYNRTPVSAENLYQQESIPYMSNVNPKEAKIGDVISFPGHVGIYLGNSVYISARYSTDFSGNQVEDGVQITKVKWEQEPKFRRLDGRQASIDENNNSETQDHYAVAGGQVNWRYADTNSQNSNLIASNQATAVDGQASLFISESSGNDNFNDEIKAQLEAINSMIASTFSITPQDSQYKKVLPEVLQAINRENPEIKTKEISKLAGVSLQQELVNS